MVPASRDPNRFRTLRERPRPLRRRGWARDFARHPSAFRAEKFPENLYPWLPHSTLACEGQANRRPVTISYIPVPRETAVDDRATGSLRRASAASCRCWGIACRPSRCRCRRVPSGHLGHLGPVGTLIATHVRARVEGILPDGPKCPNRPTAGCEPPRRPATPLTAP